MTEISNYQKLTLEDLDRMEKGVFLTGIIPQDSGHDFKYVATRGVANDWAIYQGGVEHDFTWIASMGNKLMNENLIRLITNCTDEAFLRYRF